MRTFVVRIYEDSGGETTFNSLLGLVDEVATGQRVPFRTGEELLSVLVDALRADDQPGRPGSGAQPAAGREMTAELSVIS